MNTPSTHAKVELKIDWATWESTKYACQNFHYSGCVPSSKSAKFGVWEDGIFRGVVVFGVGATASLVQQYGLKPEEGCELVRVALSTHATPVTRIVAICLRILKRTYPGLKLVVSFADPAEGHHGGIYQGGNWVYTGQSAACKYPVVNGKVVHPRVVSHMVRAGKVRSRALLPHVIKPGKHRYLYPLDDVIKLKVSKLRKPPPTRT